MEAMEGSLEGRIGFPCLTELHSGVGKNKARGPRAEKGVDVEAKLVHAGDTGRQSDEGADDRQQATKEDCDRSVSSKEVIGTVEVAAVQQHEAAVFCDERTAAPGADPVGDKRSEVAAEGAGSGDSEEGEPTSMHEVTGEGHDDLRRQRDAGGFYGHEKGDADVSGGGDGDDDEVGEDGEDFLGHSRPVYLRTGSMPGFVRIVVDHEHDNGRDINRARGSSGRDDAGWTGCGKAGREEDSAADGGVHLLQ